MNPYVIPRDPSLPPVPPVGVWEPLYCSCPEPVPVERDDRTDCGRCERELVLLAVSR